MPRSIRVFCDILKEAEDPVSNDITRLTDAWSDKIAASFTKAHFDVERRFSDHGYRLDVITRYPSFRNNYPTMMSFNFEHDHAATYLASVTLMSKKTIPVASAETIADMGDKYPALLNAVSDIIERYMKYFAVANKAHAFGAGVLRVSGFPGMRRRPVD